MRRMITGGLVLALCAAAAPLAAQRLAPTPAPSAGWLGIIFDPSPAQRGVSIREVAANSPAARAGLQGGDLVLRFDGRAATPESARALRVSPGDTVDFSIRRGGRDRQVRVIAEPRPATQAARPPTRIEVVRRPGTDERVIVIDGDTTRFPALSDSLVRAITVQMDTMQRRMRVLLADSLPVQLRRLEGAIPDIRIETDRGRRESERVIRETEALRRDVRIIRPFEAGRSAVAGAELTELNPELANYFQVAGGVLVLRVAPESPAARAGLAAGDVMTTVDGAAVTNVAEVRAAVGRMGRGPLQLEVVRRGQRRQIELRP
jgi:membrane-associated protease RseP (regulator of RpoE activity)